MSRKLAPLLIYLLFYISHFSLYADVLIGGTGEFSSGIMINPESFSNSDLNQTTIFTPKLFIETYFYNFSLIGFIGFDNFDSLYGIEELKLVVKPVTFMNINLGMFDYLPGASTFLSNTNYFARTDYEKLLTGAMEDSTVPAGIIQMELFFLDFNLLLTVSPFKQDMVLTDMDSPWFPMKGIPESLLIILLDTEYEVFLDSLAYTDGGIPSKDLADISFSSELGAKTGGLNFALLYYRGYDNTSLLEARYSRRTFNAYDTYDIELTPVYSRIDALGFNLEYSTPEVSLWIDTGYIANKSLVANYLSVSQWNTPIVTVPYLEYSLGFSLELDFLFMDMIFLAEYKESHIGGEYDFYIKPFLSSVVFSSLDFSFFNKRLSGSSSLIYSLMDGSFVVLSKLSYTPSEQLTLRLISPLFFGSANTELGQYSQNYLFSAGIVWNF